MKTNPFAYNFQEESGFKSFFDQRKPTRTEVCETAYDPTEVETFMGQNEAPSPNIANITGYSALEEASEETKEPDTDKPQEPGDTNTTVSETTVSEQEGD